jgi:hypothetical protein
MSESKPAQPQPAKPEPMIKPDRAEKPPLTKPNPPQPGPMRKTGAQPSASLGDAGELESNKVWAYGPAQAAAYAKAVTCAEGMGRRLHPNNPSTQTMEITPTGKPRGSYQVWVFDLV